MRPRGHGVNYPMEVPFFWVLSGGHLCAHLLIKDKGVALPKSLGGLSGAGDRKRVQSQLHKALLTPRG